MSRTQPYHFNDRHCSMRLITHNLLRCNARGLTEEQGYPLRIEADKTEIIESPFNHDLLQGMLRRINWPGLVSALRDLSLSPALQTLEGLPESLDALDSNLQKELHQVLFEVHVLEGTLICPTTGRKFPVKDSIPNMLLHEDEV